MNGKASIHSTIVREAIFLLNEQREEIKSLEERLEAKITFINNGWEEERYALQEENIQLKMAQYKYKCSGCGHFEKYLSRTCPNCERQNYFTGSFKKEDLEHWLLEKDGEYL